MSRKERGSGCAPPPPHSHTPLPNHGSRIVACYGVHLKDFGNYRLYKNILKPDKIPAWSGGLVVQEWPLSPSWRSCWHSIAAERRRIWIFKDVAHGSQLYPRPDIQEYFWVTQTGLWVERENQRQKQTQNWVEGRRWIWDELGEGNMVKAYLRKPQRIGKNIIPKYIHI